MLLDLGGAGQNMNSLGIHATEGSGRFGRGANLPWDDEDYHMGRHVHICHNRGEVLQHFALYCSLSTSRLQYQSLAVILIFACSGTTTFHFLLDSRQYRVECSTGSHKETPGATGVIVKTQGHYLS
jgi:hypothetical protein